MQKWARCTCKNKRRHLFQLSKTRLKDEQSHLHLGFNDAIPNHWPDDLWYECRIIAVIHDRFNYLLHVDRLPWPYVTVEIIALRTINSSVSRTGETATSSHTSARNVGEVRQLRRLSHPPKSLHVPLFRSGRRYGSALHAVP